MSLIHGLEGHRAAPTRSMPALAAAALGAALMAEQAATLPEYFKAPAKASFMTNNNQQNHNIITLPGCRTHTEVIAPLLETRFKHVANSAYLSYPKRSMTIAAVGQAMLEARRELGTDKPTSVYAISMGGIVIARLLSDPSFKREFGPIHALVLDSSPSTMKDVRPHVRAGLALAQPLRFSKCFNALSGELLTRQASAHFAEHAPDLDETTVIAHYTTTARTPLYTAASQSRLIRQARALPITDAADHIFYVQSEYDNVIDTARAGTAFRVALGEQLRVVTDASRPYGSHAAGPEYPAFVANIFADTVAQQLVS